MSDSGELKNMNRNSDLGSALHSDPGDALHSEPRTDRAVDPRNGIRAGRSAAWRLALGGVLFALTLVLTWLDSHLPPLLPIIPTRYGLANIVVMFTLLFVSVRLGASLVLLKAGFAFLIRGAMAGGISLVGGTVSLIILLLLCRPCRSGRVSLLLYSVFSAVAHNLGQVLMLVVFYTSLPILQLLPLLLIDGVISGAVTGLLLGLLLPLLPRMEGLK
ncbi:MAG: Gx transporter family protein [Clostridiaceae bacterium]|nr:Gx transporter family protein [Clostridiaceae bacterium]